MTAHTGESQKDRPCIQFHLPFARLHLKRLFSFAGVQAHYDTLKYGGESAKASKSRPRRRSKIPEEIHCVSREQPAQVVSIKANVTVATGATHRRANARARNHVRGVERLDTPPSVDTQIATAKYASVRSMVSPKMTC